MNGSVEQIENLRQKLIEVVDHHCGDFLHPNVLKISQELDLLIVRVQESRKKGDASN
ncbi:MAG TPA: aspartyl-phosphate phosphatase Spo0E family protein [Bacilli bacterium]|nr:aspartyl-phosphate phosphatase Spo0E family protein [Bacilli bacterium]